MRVSVYETIERDRIAAQRAVREAERAAERRKRELRRIKSDLVFLGMRLALIKLESALLRKYRPDQPRVPAGSGRESGRWAGGGAGSSRDASGEGKPKRTVVAQADFGALVAEIRMRAADGIASIGSTSEM